MENKLKDKKGLTEEAFLAAYDVNAFEHPSVTVDMLLLTIGEKEADDIRKLPEKELRVLLVKRAEHPYLGCWAVPGGFIGMKEGLREAVQRKIKDETGVADIYFEQLYTLGEDQEEVMRDPRTRVISVAYMALVDQTKIRPKAHDTTEDVKWFTVKKTFNRVEKEDASYSEIYTLSLESEDGKDKMDYEVTESHSTQSIYPIRKVSYKAQEKNKGHLGFDHYKLIDKAIERLKNKIEYTSLAFTLLPEQFTLSELQKVYEVILDKKLVKANFRRKISPMVIKTDSIQKSGHRPANYYTYNKDWRHNFME